VWNKKNANGSQSNIVECTILVEQQKKFLLRVAFVKGIILSFLAHFVKNIRFLIGILTCIEFKNKMKITL
jgi:hypothetical protein